MPRDIQCTIAGVDGGGFAFDNVFCIETDNVADPLFDVLDAAISDVITSILPDYKAAMAQSCILLNIASKLISAPKSYTLNRPISEPGTRVISAAVGALCPLLRFLPAAGSTLYGIYCVGAGVADFVNDSIQPAYTTLLEALGDAFLTFDGSDPVYHWQLVGWNKKTSVATPLVHRQAPHRPTTLNKRLRA